MFAKQPKLASQWANTHGNDIEKVALRLSSGSIPALKDMPEFMKQEKADKVTKAKKDKATQQDKAKRTKAKADKVEAKRTKAKADKVEAKRKVKADKPVRKAPTKRPIPEKTPAILRRHKTPNLGKLPIGNTATLPNIIVNAVPKKPLAMIEGGALDVFHPRNLSTLGLTGLGAGAVGGGLGYLAAKLSSPSYSTIKNLRKKERLSELDAIINKIRQRSEIFKRRGNI